jgi:hypothetical protein
MMRDRRRDGPRVHDAAVAIAVDGTVLLNVARLEASEEVRIVLRRALEERGQLFIGVAATPREAARILGGLADGVEDATSHVIGARRARKRRGDHVSARLRTAPRGRP